MDIPLPSYFVAKETYRHLSSPPDVSPDTGSSLSPEEGTETLCPVWRWRALPGSGSPSRWRTQGTERVPPDVLRFGTAGDSRSPGVVEEIYPLPPPNLWEAIVQDRTPSPTHAISSF